MEYYLGSKDDAKRKSQKSFAAKITGPGGTAISVTVERTFPNRGQRFQGKIKFFDARKGFGFISPASDFSFGGNDFKSTEANIHIAREDIKAESAECAPNLKDGADVEYTLFKNTDDKWGAADVTKNGGTPFVEDDFATKKCGWPKKNRFQNKGGFGKMKGAGPGQMFMMNGMPYMMMPMGGMMGGGGGWFNKKKGKKGKGGGSW